MNTPRPGSISRLSAVASPSGQPMGAALAHTGINP